MRWIAAALLVLLSAPLAQTPAWADPGGYQLVSKDGKAIAPPDGTPVADVPWETIGLAATARQAPACLKDVISRTVINCERVVRVPPPDNATTAQMQLFLKKKREDLQKAVEPARGDYVFDTVHVIDVVALDNPEHGKYLVFADVDWQSWTVMTDSDAGAIQHLDAQRNVKNPDVPRAEIDDRITAIQLQTISHKPVQMAYLLTNDDAVLKWTRNSTQNIRGYIQTVAAYVYPQVKDPKSPEAVRTAYVGLEFIVADVR